MVRTSQEQRKSKGKKASRPVPQRPKPKAALKKMLRRSKQGPKEKSRQQKELLGNVLKENTDQNSIASTFVGGAVSKTWWAGVKAQGEYPR